MSRDMAFGIFFGLTGAILTYSLFHAFSQPKTSFDRIKESDIKVYENSFTVNSPRKLAWGPLAGTGSMLPCFGKNHHTIETTEFTKGDIRIGDVIIFKREEDRIIHRVIGIGSDEQGWYAITRGDNNGIISDGKIRFGQITGILIAVLY